MTNITRHPLIQQAYDVCQAIEACGASVELTNAVTKASNLMRAIDDFIPVLPAGTESLPPHQQRVVAECEQLADRIQKLEAFLSTPIYAGLPERERQLLKMQADAMVVYLGIINTRVEDFGRAA
ncbi:crAss001_48 related protein [Pseudomonas sp. NBRC 111125]|uniref:crAss001_48 related protein n=1 Tax=Pseudomonas sp. NBRC 111125 TaxID=1661040 RepID=UPI000761B446|nr:hypothetical protein [Pseudomonas sp. NBRC 111125]